MRKVMFCSIRCAEYKNVSPRGKPLFHFLGKYEGSITDAVNNREVTEKLVFMRPISSRGKKRLIEKLSPSLYLRLIFCSTPS